MRAGLTLFLVLLSALGVGTCYARAADAPPWSIVPQPAISRPAVSGSVEVANGDLVAVKAPAAQRGQALVIVRRFVSRVAKSRSLMLQLDPSAKHPRIVFELNPSDAGIASNAGYRVHVGDGEISVKARTARGLFYGATTTWQLLTPTPRTGAVRVADGHIEDFPRFEWRGLMVDSARHFQTVVELKNLIDWMSLHKLDRFHWHLTDDQGWRIEIKRYPQLTSMSACRKAVGQDAALTGDPDKPYCGFYTQAQIRDIVKYAAARFVTVVPEIEMPGHSQAALHAYPGLGVTGKRPPVATDWGISTWLLAPNERSLQFIENVLDEVMALFPSTYIHMGGDEAAKDQWEASPQVQARLTALGFSNMDQLQDWMMGKVAVYLAAHGRTMIGWDEILQAPNLPKSAVVMSWHGVSGAVKAASLGHQAILTPWPQLYLNFVQSTASDEPAGRPDPVDSLQKVYAFDPLPKGIGLAQSKYLLGLEAALWTSGYNETFAEAQHAIFPRMAAWSEVAWSPQSAINWGNFLRRMPAELSRYNGLGIAYADSAWAPRFRFASEGSQVSVTLSNQVDQGDIRYTTDGSAPTAHSERYTAPISLPGEPATTLRAATFTNEGFRLSRPRTRDVSGATLLTRNSSQLKACGPRGDVLRVADDRPLRGPRPVYQVNIFNTCWMWDRAPLTGISKISIRVGNLPWREMEPDLAKLVTVRAKQTEAGELDVRLDTCTGRLLARIPLAKAAKSELQTTLNGSLPAIDGHHNVCIYATGDPRSGTIWAIDRVQLRPATK